ncbi:hypothetical protein BGZ65_010490, partial [Modicella reniformis]
KVDDRRKNKDPGEGLNSISAIETGLPSLRDEGVSLAHYIVEHEAVKDQFDEFYKDNDRFK